MNAITHKLSARQQRVLSALAKRTNGVPREEVDRIAPASNGPDIISQLRYRHGVEITTDLVPFITKDGERSRYGVYSLTKEGVVQAQRLLGGTDA